MGLFKRLRLYLDTSVISYLDQHDAPEKMQNTLALWQDIQQEKIVSWNFKHMVNVKTIRGVRGIASIKGYGAIDIVQPTMLLESEE